MKKNKINIILVSLFFVICFTFSYQSVELSKKIIVTFFNNIFPSLFPFFICSYLLIETNILEIISYLLQYLSVPLLHLNGYGCLIIIISIITGTPFGASLIPLLLKKGKLSSKEAFVLSISILYPSWSFMYVTIGQLIGKTNALKICLSIYLSSFLLLLVLSSFYLKKPSYIHFKDVKSNILKDFNLPKTLKNTIQTSFINLTTILGTMIYFSLPLVLIKKGILLQSLIEFSSASFSIIESTIKNKLAYLTFTFSFGSFSLIMQHLSMIEGVKTKLKHILFSRIFTVIFSSIFLLLLT